MERLLKFERDEDARRRALENKAVLACTLLAAAIGLTFDQQEGRLPACTLPWLLTLAAGVLTVVAFSFAYLTLRTAGASAIDETEFAGPECFTKSTHVRLQDQCDHLLQVIAAATRENNEKGSLAGRAQAAALFAALAWLLALLLPLLWPTTQLA